MCLYNAESVQNNAETRSNKPHLQTVNTRKLNKTAPGVDIETPAGCQHVNAWRLEWKFSGKYQFPMVVATYKNSTVSTHIRIADVREKPHDSHSQPPYYLDMVLL